MKPTAINLFGAPGSGKSTAAAKLFGSLKERGVNCELITEFAKDLVWEQNDRGLLCQPYIFGVQFFRMMRCTADVDVLICDSPLLLSIVHNKDVELADGMRLLVTEALRKFRNINFCLESPDEYDCVGRVECPAEAAALGRRIIQELDTQGEEYRHIAFDDDRHEIILRDVLQRIEKTRERKDI